MKIYSIAIFGSSLRPDFDKYSDKDLLIVANTYSKLNKLRQQFEMQGFSVTTYTYKKLEFLSKKGSLFVQHLRNESSIMTDHKGKLNEILVRHKASTPTAEQISESIDYFKFLSMIPDSKWGYAWYCDCFYVGLRNHLILNSALKGEFKFSFVRLIDDLLKNIQIETSDFEILRQLRVVKKNYRERIEDELPSKYFVESLIRVGQKLRISNTATFVHKKTFNDHTLNEIKKESTNYYFRLRLIEMYYLLSGQRNTEIDKVICNPQFYALKFKNIEFINRLINDIEGKNGTQQPFAVMGADVVNSRALLL